MFYTADSFVLGPKFISSLLMITVRPESSPGVRRRGKRFSYAEVSILFYMRKVEREVSAGLGKKKKKNVTSYNYKASMSKSESQD